MRASQITPIEIGEREGKEVRASQQVFEER